MKRRPAQLFQPRVRLYLGFMLIFAIATFFFGYYNNIIAIGMLVSVIFLAIYSRVESKLRTARLLDYIESVSDGLDSTVRDLPFPVVIFSSETSEIIWSNELFKAVCNVKNPLFDARVDNVVPGFNANWLLEGKNESPEPVPLEDRKYRVYGSIMQSEREYIAATYWVDVTDFTKISDEYLASRPIFAILIVDNYEDLLKALSEKEKSILLSDIDEVINSWIEGSGGYLCKFDRDRYFFLFEERKLHDYIHTNFSLLDAVRSCMGAGGVQATLSIGIGKDGLTPIDNYRYATLAVEMALSRGGAQAVIRNKQGFEFFGGHSPQHESRTKVKSRIMASAFGELLTDSAKLLIMGHANADFDSLGAAIGVACIARARGIHAKIVIDMETNHALKLLDIFTHIHEYKGVFISQQKAIIDADTSTLLVVVDTSRPDMVESKTLLQSGMRVAVIDHHRRAADFIDHAVFNYHELQASSTCEMVTEMMQYLVERNDILKDEAKALLSGIVLDTKGFSINTTDRTFEAAAYLRRIGVDMVSVKQLIQTDIDTAVSRYALMLGASIYKPGIAIATSLKPQSRVSIAQAADELLGLEGVTASFVAAMDAQDVLVSARSSGEINVQLILEKLGGGGSRLTAGLQLQGADLAKVIKDLKKAIDDYLAITRKV